MNFSESFLKKPVLFKHYQTDWTEEDKKFRAGIAQFRLDIACANERSQKKDEKSTTQQVVAPIEVIAKPQERHEENPTRVQDPPAASVELRNVGASYCDDPTLQPAQPKEYHLPKEPSPATDPLDDLFGTSTGSVSPAPVAEPDPFDSAPGPQAVNFPPAEDPKPVVEPTPAAAPAPSPEPVRNVAMEGFDVDAFKETEQKIASMLARVPKADIDSIAAMIPDFCVSMDLDHFRENPEILSDRIVQVQAKLDSLYAQIMKVRPERHMLESVWEYVSKVGLAFSSASNHEKRAAQAKIRLRDTWERYVYIDSLFSSLEQTYNHLKNQFDTLSRLITCRQEHNKEVARGAVPFEPAAMPVPSMTPPSNLDPEIANSDLSQPLGARHFNGLDDFPKNPQKMAQRDDKYKKGPIEF